MRAWWRGVLAGVAGLVVLLIATTMFAGNEPRTIASTEVKETSTEPHTTTTLDMVPTIAPPGGSDRVIVTRIVDGDTVEIELLSGESEIVRLIGINTPESGECFAEAASVALDTLLSNRVVTMTMDTTDRDQYGRLLRYLWLDRGVFVNGIMVRGGYAQARDFPPDSFHAALIAAAQESARAESIGIWAGDACGPPTDADLRVIEVLADAPGSDNDNLEGEWVDVVNAGLSDVPMDGWVLKDESARHRYSFPDDFVLPPHATVRVRTGCGQDDDETLYWCNGSAIWNNKGDTAFLLDPYGNIASFYEY